MNCLRSILGAGDCRTPLLSALLPNFSEISEVEKIREANHARIDLWLQTGRSSLDVVLLRRRWKRESARWRTTEKVNNFCIFPGNSVSSRKLAQPRSESGMMQMKNDINNNSNNYLKNLPRPPSSRRDFPFPPFSLFTAFLTFSFSSVCFPRSRFEDFFVLEVAPSDAVALSKH